MKSKTFLLMTRELETLRRNCSKSKRRRSRWTKNQEWRLHSI